MLVLNKKSKIFLYIIIFVLLVLGGFAVEHFEKDVFVMETVATEDYIPYERPFYVNRGDNEGVGNK